VTLLSRQPSPPGKRPTGHHGKDATRRRATLVPASQPADGIDRELESMWRRSPADAHLDQLASAIDAFRAEAERLIHWGEHLARVLVGGGRLLVAGNGGSAAEAQHLSAELVGKLCGDRRALSAIALHAETSSMTAIGNDYGYDQVFARQIEAHGRPGDVVILMSTSGRSQNLLVAADTARRLGLTSWAMTGPMPNPLALRCDDALCVAAGSQTAQELHLVAVHVLAGQVDAALPAATRALAGREAPDG
jgi:D-sedoheptulose 7-phosphate isomerase